VKWAYRRSRYIEILDAFAKKFRLLGVSGRRETTPTCAEVFRQNFVTRSQPDRNSSRADKTKSIPSVRGVNSLISTPRLVLAALVVYDDDHLAALQIRQDLRDRIELHRFTKKINPEGTLRGLQFTNDE
jgi:hypothetical protein